MRRKEKEIKDQGEIAQILAEAKVCRLAMVDGKMPYLVPLSFGIEGDCLYFHSSPEGRKIEILKANPHVCFEMDQDSTVVEAAAACKWSVRYRSVIGFGRAEFLTEAQEKKEAFQIIMRHYSERKFHFSDDMVKDVALIKVTISKISAKQSGH